MISIKCIYDSGCKTIKNKKIINSGLSLDLLCCRKNKNSKLHLESYMPNKENQRQLVIMLFYFLCSTTLTVVADKWEIPHSCVRIGRVLGSGAFGYVVKGRINRSILKHRGIKEPVDADQKNIYVSVAVKLIQGKSILLKIFLR